MALSQLLSVINSVASYDESKLNKFERRVIQLRHTPGYQYIVETGIEPMDVANVNVNELQQQIEAMQSYSEDLSQSEPIKTEPINLTSNCQAIEKSVQDTRHLDFPSRLMNCTAPNRITTDLHVPILKDIYSLYGNMFDNMSCEDFMYLFGGLRTAPATYNPPYYWNGYEPTLKGILRVLYLPQPRLLRKLILTTSDRDAGIDEHDWGRNKNKVSYFDIEKNIQEIIKRVSGMELKSL